MNQMFYGQDGKSLDPKKNRFELYKKIEEVSSCSKQKREYLRSLLSKMFSLQDLIKRNQREKPNPYITFPFVLASPTPGKNSSVSSQTPVIGTNLGLGGA